MEEKIPEMNAKTEEEVTVLQESEVAEGEELKSGTTNVLITREIIVSHKDARELICQCCGHKRKVSTYEIK